MRAVPSETLQSSPAPCIMRGHARGQAACNPGWPSPETGHAHNLIVDVQPPELRDTFLLSASHRLWYFV